MVHPFNTMRAILLTNADILSRPSKVRGAVLPQEYTLSRFVSNLASLEESWTEATPACEWRYVLCNAEKQVTSLGWDNKLFEDETDEGGSEFPILDGPLLWEYIPHTLILFTAYVQDLSGPVPLSVLPNCLTKFNIRTNECSGQLDLIHLPSALEILDLRNNQFEGTIDLTRLPAHLKCLYLGGNNLSGSLDLTHVSENVQNINLEHNFFNVQRTVPNNVEFGTQALPGR